MKLTFGDCHANSRLSQWPSHLGGCVEVLATVLLMLLSVNAPKKALGNGLGSLPQMSETLMEPLAPGFAVAQPRELQPVEARTSISFYVSLLCVTLSNKYVHYSTPHPQVMLKVL